MARQVGFDRVTADWTRLFLCGDVMLGRGVDQILAHPGKPILYEGRVDSAMDYVTLAERKRGPLPRRVASEYVWGDLPADLHRHGCDARLINLECAVTTANEPAPKGINYRMHPKNVPVLNALPADAVVLANNHVLDWGSEGLVETLDVLHEAGVATVGAGRTAEEAGAPLVLDPGRGSRILILAFGDETSGIPQGWAAGPDSPGINPLPKDVVAEVRRRVNPIRRAGDLLVVSIHWGGNWGYRVPAENRAVAHALVDHAGVHVVHGHSSHHPKAFEVRNDRLILYGCGDLINDYEGIEGHEEYRSDLVLGYLAKFEMDSNLTSLALLAYRVSAFRLCRPGPEGLAWLADSMNRECRKVGAGLVIRADGVLEARDFEGRLRSWNE